MSLGPISNNSNTCFGAIFELDVATSIGPTGIPNWVFGDTFLKNVYSVFRYQPPGMGFAELNDVGNASSGEYPT